MKSEKEILEWRVHTPNLLGEILNNKGTGVLRQPLIIFIKILSQVAERVAEIEDEKLIELMVRLTMYEFSDPQSKEYDKNAVSKILNN